MDFLYTLIIYPIYTIIEIAFTLVQRILRSTGLSVIGVSVAITLLCLPLYAVAEKWQEAEREKQDRMRAGLSRIKKAFSGDERYMMTTTFYRQHHYSPIMGLRGSFGLLIQIPFFLAAYSYLSHLPDLRGMPFFFIRDMGSPDALFSIGHFSVNVLPVTMTLINCVSGIIYSKGHGLREKAQIFVMAAVFLIVLYDSPAGLVLYWTFNNIFSLAKNIFYKLKNPLRSFWLFCCAMCVPAMLFVMLALRTSFFYKTLFVAFVAAVWLAPLILRGVRAVFRRFLLPLSEGGGARTTIYVLSCLLLFILSGLTIPSSLISSSPVEFSGVGANPDPLGYLGVTLMQAAGFFLFWPLCVYFLFGRKVQSVMTLLMASAAVSALLDSFVFMPDYGDVSATLTFLNTVDFRTVSFVSLMNLLALAAAALLVTALIARASGRILAYSFGILSLAMIALAGMNVRAIRSQYKDFVGSGSLSEVALEPIFHLSKERRNVVVIMLDRAESQFVTEIFKEDESLGDIYSGFVFYPNTLSFNGHTMMGAPLIYGGYEYQPLEMNRRKDERLFEKTNEAILMLPRVFTERLGFSAVITDPSWANYSAYADLSITDGYERISGYQTIGKYTAAWYKSHPEESDFDNIDDILGHNMLFFSFFRESPVILREMVYRKGKYWNSNKNLTSYNKIIDNYAPLDFLSELTDFTGGDEGAYVCMVNEFTHSSVFMQAPDYVPARTVSDLGTSRFRRNPAYHTNMAAIKRIAEWISYLKENGAYDNTRIILVSDHSNLTSEDCMEEDVQLDMSIAGDRYRGRGHFHPLLMVKDFGADGAMREDMTFMTNGDVPSLALSSLADNPVNPFTGNPIPLDTAPIKKDGVTVTSSDVHQAWLYKSLCVYPIRSDQWWRVRDSVFKASSWSRESIED